jgi:hypothetical protein
MLRVGHDENLWSHQLCLTDNYGSMILRFPFGGWVIHVTANMIILARMTCHAVASDCSLMAHVCASSLRTVSCNIRVGVATQADAENKYTCSNVASLSKKIFCSCSYLST